MPLHIEDVAADVLISLGMTCTVILTVPLGHWAINTNLVDIGSAISRRVFL